MIDETVSEASEAIEGIYNLLPKLASENPKHELSSLYNMGSIKNTSDLENYLSKYRASGKSDIEILNQIKDDLEGKVRKSEKPKNTHQKYEGENKKKYGHNRSYNKDLRWNRGRGSRGLR